MTTRRAAPDFGVPVTDSEGRQTQEFSDWIQEVNLLLPIQGNGSPEGVVPGRQAQSYYDLSAAAGSIHYVKTVDNVGGDDTLGWLLA